MKLSHKVTWMTASISFVFVVVIMFGLPFIFNELTTMQMNNHAKTFGLFLRENLLSLAMHEPDIFTKPDSSFKFQNLVQAEFDKAIRIGQETDSFVVRSINLIDITLLSRISWPANTVIQPIDDDPAIRNALSKPYFDIHQDEVAGVQIPNIREMLVSLQIPGSKPWVILVHLDFQKSMDLHRDQYLFFEIGAAISAIMLMFVLMIVLLRFIRNMVVKPASLVSIAMDAVGRGDLKARIDYRSKDEFGIISNHFNTMVDGLKEKIALSNYVSDSTLEAVHQTVKSGESFHRPYRKTVTVLFSDIRGFTSYSENRDPEIVIAVLNRILDIQATIIKRFKGDIDKFIGDEVMAIFPDADTAIECAFNIQLLMQKSKSDLDDLQLGIGICSGPVVQGDVGIATMKNYTVIGDTVNTAARLQAVALGGEIIVPLATFDADMLARYRTKAKGILRLKGKENEIEIVKVIGMQKMR